MRRVYCPPVVPASYVSVSATRTDPPRSYLLELYSDIDRKESGGHWAIAAGPPRVMGWQLDAAVNPMPRRGRLRGTPVRLYKMAPYPGGGYHSGHFVVAWRRGGAEYQVSLHGYHNAGRAKAIAAALIDQMTRCTSERPSTAGSCALVFVARPRRLTRTTTTNHGRAAKTPQ